MKPIIAFALLWASIIYFPDQTTAVAAKANMAITQLNDHVAKLLKH